MSLNLTPINLLPPIETALGDLDGVASALKLKASASQYEYKAKMTEQTDMIKQLKGALKGQLERCRSLSQVLAPMQEEVNGRLQSLGQEAALQKSLSDRLQSELETARQQSDERGRRAREFKDALTTTQATLAEQVKFADSERMRAETAEAALKERSAEVDRLLDVETELRESVLAQEEAAAATASQAEKAAATAAAQAAEREASHEQQVEEAAKRFKQHKEASEEREATLQKELAAATARGDELGTQLAEKMTSLEALATSHSALQQTHSALEKTSISQTTSMQMMQSQLEELKASLAQKDADLRQTMNNLAEMQRTNAEQVQNERSRAEKFERELRDLRDSEQELRGKVQAAAVDVERLTGDLSAQKERLTETLASLQVAEADRDRQAIQLSEQSDELKSSKESVERLSAELAERRELLAARSAESAGHEENAKKLSTEKHKLQVEFDSYKEHHGTSNQQQMAAISDLKLTVDKLSVEVQHKQTEVVAQAGNLHEQSAFISSLQQKLLDADNMRRQLHNNIQELKGNIRVFCRVRPVLEDHEMGLRVGDTSRLCLSHNSESYNFSFDKVFSGETKQPVVFEEVDGLVQSALDGYKVCIFAYGQTGSGKTFTMQGTKDPEQWGLIPRSLSKILRASQDMRDSGWEWKLEASFLEVYNEQLRDLLHSGDGAPASLAIKHDDAWGTVVANATTMPISSMAQINELIVRAGKARAVGATDMNAQSSRSHSVFALYLTGTNASLGTELHGALHLVDLAGSERLDKSGATGDRLRETQNINKSLSSLADVFMAKAEKRSHVPFRNSKLTHLMEPCLSGQGKTLMVVNVGPEAGNSHETLCSLRFASQVNQCDTGGKPKRSSKPVGAGGAGAKSSRPQTAPTGPASKRPK